MAINYELKLVLSSFLDARIIQSEDSEGVSEEGVFIPFGKNGLKPTSHGKVIAYAFVNERLTKTVDKYDFYVRLRTTKEHLAKLDSLGYKTPYLGGMRRQLKYHPKYQDNMDNSKVKKIE